MTDQDKQSDTPNDASDTRDTDTLKRVLGILPELSNVSLKRLKGAIDDAQKKRERYIEYCRQVFWTSWLERLYDRHIVANVVVKRASFTPGKCMPPHDTIQRRCTIELKDVNTNLRAHLSRWYRVEDNAMMYRLRFYMRYEARTVTVEKPFGDETQHVSTYDSAPSFLAEIYKTSIWTKVIVDDPNALFDLFERHLQEK